MINNEVKSIKGFSLIELMTVMAIVSLLVAVALPILLGFRNSARAKTFIANAKSAEGEIQSWAESAISHNSELRLHDTNCDGEVNAKDKTNGEIFTGGIAKTYVECRNYGFKETSPWIDGISLWKFDEPAGDGQITLVQTGNRIDIIAKNKTGEILYKETISY